jgi:hypothetical protein
MIGKLLLISYAFTIGGIIYCVDKNTPISNDTIKETLLFIN